MLCRKCQQTIPDNSLYCNFCGTKQEISKRKPKTRGSGQGTVYKRPCGTWTAQVTLGYYIQDGKRKRKVAQKYGFKTKKEALAYITILQNGVEKQKQITVAELWEQFRTSEMETLSKSKQTAYRIAWRKIEDDVAWRTIDSFSTPELQDIVDSCGTSYYTCRDIKTLLSHLFKLALRDDLVDKNKTQYIKLPPKEQTERIIFTDEQVEQLWEDYRQTNDIITARMLIMMYTGIRPGELLTIQCDNIHLSENYMTGGIKTAKGKARKIVIPTIIDPLISFSMDHSRKGLLAWYNKAEDFYNAWRDKRAALNLPEALTPYCCRHTYVTRLTALKVSPAMLQELAGHEDYDTTLIYTHLSVDDCLLEVNKLK